MTKTFWNLWSSYAIYYFGKVNLSIVVPVLLATYGNLSLYHIGFVTTGFMIAYALGQFLHGQLSEKYNPFVYAAVGLLGSAIINLTLGFTAGFFWMLLIGEIIDGGFQSMGWSSIVRANAMTSKNPEKTSTILGTSYQAGNSIAWVICGFTIGQFGWEWGFWTASIVMAIRAITLYYTRPKLKLSVRKFKERVKFTLSFPIFLSGISLGLLNMVRFGVISWIPTYLFREHAMPIEKVGLSIFFIPIAGIIGTLLYNKIRLPKDLSTIIYLVLLGITLLILPGAVGMKMMILLILGGLFLYGPHVFLVSTIPSRFHKQSVVAASAGFIDGWGYIGSAAIGILVPIIINSTGNWNAVFWFWSAIAFTVALIVLAVYIKETRGGHKNDQKLHLH